MIQENNATTIARVINELGYENLEALIKISRQSPSTIHMVIEKILEDKIEQILLTDSQTSCEAQLKSLQDLEHKDFHRSSFCNGWNQSLSWLREKWVKIK